MKITLRLFMAIAVLMGLTMRPVFAEESSQSMKGMDHSKMKGMDHSKMKGMDHSKMKGMQLAPMKGMNHGNPKSDTGMAGMEGMGSMQGGVAPADARDPHAYSGGYTLVAGPYALPAEQRLRLGDEHNFASLLFDRLEAAQSANGSSAAYEMQAWFGRDYDRAVLKSEGNYETGQFSETSTELLWSHAVASYWNRDLGVRYDGGKGPGRTWLAFGLQGLAPYWFEVDATAYVGEEGRTALGLAAEYEIMFTQKLVLQASAEAEIYGKDDPARGIGSGLSELATGLRLRYEIRREFAPYLGIEWASKFDGTADYAVAEGEKISEIKAVAGLRFWF